MVLPSTIATLLARNFLAAIFASQEFSLIRKGGLFNATF
jgi:hypothetical protein